MTTDQKANGNWFHRLATRLRPGGRRNFDELPPAGTDGLLVTPADDETDEDAENNALTRWPRRDTALTRLQEGYEKVNQVIADMQKHMASQSERTDRMCSAIENLSRALGEWPDVASQQTRLLQSILGQSEAAHARSEKWASTLESLPKAMKTQESALGGINQHLAMIAEQSVVESKTMEKLGGTIQQLNDQGNSQTQLLNEVVARLTEQHAHFQSSVNSGTRRFTILWIVTLLLAAGGLTAAILALVGV